MTAKPTLYKLYCFLILCTTLFAACNTGIESTKTIKMSKSERKETQPSDEQNFADRFTVQYLKDWKNGKMFLITDDKASVLLENTSKSDLRLEGKKVVYAGSENRPTAGENEVCILKFKDVETGDLYNYNTKKSPKNALNEISGLDLPLMIDLDLVNSISTQLKGKELWTRSQFWYDGNGNNIVGKKFIPVIISDVKPGNMYFPVLIEFLYEDTKKASFYMNVKSVTGIGAESRTFPMLFSLTDPRIKYPSISDEVWNNIREGKVALGMTKEECKLSLGNPTDVDSGHDWNNTIDIWRYSNGTFLNFQDGLLVNFRH